MLEKIKTHADNLKSELMALSKAIYEHPELGNEEFYALKAHTDLLKKHGFNVVENYLDVATGFKATYSAKNPGPVIAYMSEYDALPGIGHGCGHNILGTTSTGAGIVLSKIIDQIGGSVVVFGTPAEETSGAKVLFVNRGGFEDIDVAMMAHPNHAFCRSGKSLALEAVEFEYFGKTSHAASAPEKGINALDAVINTFNAINALRQQTQSDARIHGIIKEGGKAANIIPDYCLAQFYVRAQTKSYLQTLVEKVKRCAKGAALAAGVELKISNYELSYDNLVTNKVLDNLFAEKLIACGVSKDKIESARESFGSLDAGNVSHVCPTIHPYFDITNDKNIVAHTVEFASCTLTDFANDNMIITVKTLAAAGAEVIQNKALLREIKKEFENTKKCMP